MIDVDKNIKSNSLLELISSPPLPQPIYKQSSIPSHLNCPVCYQILKIPKRLYCGHTYCLKCIQQIFLGNKIGGSKLVDNYTCPICRQIIDKDKIGTDRIAEGIILELIVYCPNAECPWEGPYKNMEQHFKQECLFKDSSKPIWHSVFPQYAPKQMKQTANPASKSSLIARIYAKNKQLQQQTSFKDLKQKLQANNTKLTKKDQLKQKMKQKANKQIQKDLENRLKSIEQMFIEKTSQQLQKEQSLRKQQKQKQKQLIREKNKKQVEKLIKLKEEKRIFQEEFIQKQKILILQKQAQQKKQIQQNFRTKLDCLKKLYQFKHNDNQQFQKCPYDESRNNIKKPQFTPHSGKGLMKYKPSYEQMNHPFRYESKNNNNSPHTQILKKPFPSHIKPVINKLPKKSLHPSSPTQKIFNSQFKKNPNLITKTLNSLRTVDVIIPQQNPDQIPDYMKKPHCYAATYEKHRLIRKPYIPLPSDNQIPEKIPHRYYTNFNQFSDPQYLNSDKANRKGQYMNLQIPNKQSYTGTANLKLI